MAALRQARECPLGRPARQARDRAMIYCVHYLMRNAAAMPSSSVTGFACRMRHARWSFFRRGPKVRLIAATMPERLSLLRWELEEQPPPILVDRKT
jgi:hypothetical protein